jgi:hypothetical protein
MQIKDPRINTTGKREKMESSGLDRFVSEQNIARYRKLLNPKTSEDQRRTILRLLKEESSQLARMTKI